MKPKAFLSIFIISSISFSLGILALNSFCLQKKLNLHPRYEQALALEEKAPNTLVLGSSRQEHIPLDSCTWPAGLRPVCSIRSPMETPNRMKLHLLHALEFCPIKEVWLCLDFFTFNTYNQGPPDPSFFLQKPLPENPQRRWLALKAFKTKRALSAVTDLLYFQRNCKSMYPKLKLRFKKNTFLSKTELPQKEDLEGNLRRLESLSLNETFFISPPKQFTFDPVEGLRPKIEAFKDLLQLCYKQSFEVKIIINPFHARFFELIHAGGLWENYQAWLKAIVTAVEAIARTSNKAPYPIFDFSGYSNYNTEVFRFKENIPGQWYIESSHFNKNLGEKMIERLYGPDSLALETEGFGKLLCSGNLQAHIAELEQDRQAYISTHRDDIASIRALYHEWIQANRLLGIRKKYEEKSAYLQPGGSL